MSSASEGGDRKTASPGRQINYRAVGLALGALATFAALPRWVPGIVGSAGESPDGTRSEFASTMPSASAATCPCTAFQPGETPTVDGTLETNALEVGVRFRVLQDGFITGLRYYKGVHNTGAHIGHLWSASGALLAEATFTGETATGWQEVTLATPVHVAVNATYVASYHSTGSYAYTSGYFSTALVRGPLRLLADGEDGGNGLFQYGPVRFPTSTYQSTNYWVDVVFNNSVPADATPPAVVATTPTASQSGVPTSGTAVIATFSEALAPASVTSSSVVLRDASQNIVSATVRYDAVARTVTLTPAAALQTATTYTVKLEGGAASPHLTDLTGNALATDFLWSFTTTAPAPPAITDGPGGPILVISNPSNAFSRYPVEILRAEGFNLFAARDLSTVTSTVLNGYDVVILGETSLNSTQVTLFTNWVNAGGTLIALKPSKNLAGLLGLTDANGTLINRYLKVNATGAGVGIESQTMQYHGTADLYTLNGATALATLYSTSTTSTPNPAVTQRTVGGNGGQAIAFTYDLARSVVFTRQGNPAWAGQERDGITPIRSNDLFFGNAASDPQPDWVDLAKVAIPQADEQQRLLANCVIQGNLHRKPLPRFWYFPKGKKAVVVMTGDDHGDAGMQPRFDLYRQQSPPNCSEPDWDCVRATGYEWTGTGFTDAQARFYHDRGFEIGYHIQTNCADWTPASLDAAMTSQLASFASTFPSIPAPNTNRTHCIAWSDWATMPLTEAAHGIRLDTNYYFYPPAWVSDRPGLFTGSGIPMRFARTDGTMIDCYQVTTQMTDESGQTYPMTADSLLERALGSRGYFGAFCANMHFDTPDHPGSNAIVTSAVARGVPVVSSRQLLAWLDGRYGSSFNGVTWSSGTLSFTIAVATGARNLYGMVPRQTPSGTLATLTRNGGAVAFTNQTIKGISYAMFQAEPGLYAANYTNDGSAPSISSLTGTANSDGTATITWTTNESATTRVDYGTSSGTLDQSALNAALVTSHSMKLTGLTGGTTYYYRAFSADAHQNGTTSPNPPTAPRNLTTVSNTAPVAVAAGAPAAGTAPLAVAFSGAASTDANHDSLTYTWAFGDGGSATGRLVGHTYAASGGFAAVLTVTDGRGGQDTASVAIVAAAPAFPQTTVLDRFDRADGPPGSPWVDETTGFGVTSNELAATSSPTHMEWNGTTFGTSQEAYVTLASIDAAAYAHSLMLKTQGNTWTSGHLEASYNPAGSKVVVSSFTPPTTWVTLGIIGDVTFSPGDRFGARAFNDGSVEVFRNTTLLGTVSASGWPYAALNGRIGLSAEGAWASRFDNFGGGTVPPPGSVLGAPAAELARRGVLSLSSAYPNPARGEVSLSLGLPRDGNVSVRVLDVTGRQVWQSPARHYAAGQWTLTWDGTLASGPAAPGIYLLRVMVDDHTFARRVALMK